jgi:hypothetical protein
MLSPGIYRSNDAPPLERCRQSLERLAELVNERASEALLLVADGILDDAVWSLTHEERRAADKGPRDSGMIPLVVAERIARGGRELS